MVALLAASALALITLLAITLALNWPVNRPDQPTLAKAPESARSPVSPEDAPRPAESAVPTSVPTHTTLSLSELSGPELEALLDLKPAVASVSF